MVHPMVNTIVYLTGDSARSRLGALITMFTVTLSRILQAQSLFSPGKKLQRRVLPQNMCRCLYLN